MKKLLRKLFAPILNLFENGDGNYVYKASHRVILLFVSVMFLGLGTLALVLMPAGDYSYSFPVLIFGGAGLLGLIVGLLGTVQGVAKIWGSR
jgi:hypothetical protein